MVIGAKTGVIRLHILTLPGAHSYQLYKAMPYVYESVCFVPFRAWVPCGQEWRPSWTCFQLQSRWCRQVCTDSRHSLIFISFTVICGFLWKSTEVFIYSTLSLATQFESYVRIGNPSTHPGVEGGVGEEIKSLKVFIIWLDDRVKEMGSSPPYPRAFFTIPRFPSPWETKMAVRWTRQLTATTTRKNRKLWTVYSNRIWVAADKLGHSFTCFDNHCLFVVVPMPRWPTWRTILDETLDENWVQTRGLPEDMSLLGFTPLTAIHSRLDRKWSRLTRDCQYLEVQSNVTAVKRNNLCHTSALKICISSIRLRSECHKKASIARNTVIDKTKYEAIKWEVNK